MSAALAAMTETSVQVSTHDYLTVAALSGALGASISQVVRAAVVHYIEDAVVGPAARFALMFQSASPGVAGGRDPRDRPLARPRPLTRAQVGALAYELHVRDLAPWREVTPAGRKTVTVSYSSTPWMQAAVAATVGLRIHVSKSEMVRTALRRYLDVLLGRRVQAAQAPEDFAVAAEGMTVRPLELRPPWPDTVWLPRQEVPTGGGDTSRSRYEQEVDW